MTRDNDHKGILEFDWPKGAPGAHSTKSRSLKCYLP